MEESLVGIDDMALYVPKLYLPISVLAEERNISYEKLNKGLGLENLAIPDVHEDTATMAANAIVELMERNQLNPNSIGRIYLGTESALDGAKPTATYVLEMLRRKYRDQWGVHCLRNCDVVDLTFACVGGVDALQNTLDWVKSDPERIGIVVCADFAKYELGSTGEYTQGAGAIALLISHQPRLMTIDNTFGVATMGVHDFFKPKKNISKLQLIKEVLDLAGVDHIRPEEVLGNIPETLSSHGVLDDTDSMLNLRKDTPVFDGQYSNFTYQNRIREAFLDFKNKKIRAGSLNQHTPVIGNWERLIFHLPYAAHGRRIASELFMLELSAIGKWTEFATAYNLIKPEVTDFPDKETYQQAYSQFLRAVTKTKAYKEFVLHKLSKAEVASSEVGNMYACSGFLALMSTLFEDFKEGAAISGKKYGFIGYGSGSKSKVFEATIQSSWKEVVRHFDLNHKLSSRKAVDYTTYENLHRMKTDTSILQPSGEFQLSSISEVEMKEGARYYEWVNTPSTSSEMVRDFEKDLAK